MHANQRPEPPQLTFFDVEEQRIRSELLPADGTPYLTCSAEPYHPTEETYFSCLYSVSFFRSWSILHDHSWWLQCRWTVNHKLCLSTQPYLHHDNRSNVFLNESDPDLVIHLLLNPIWLVNKTPRYLNSIGWGRGSSPTQINWLLHGHLHYWPF